MPKPKLPMLAARPVADALARRDMTHQTLADLAGLSRVSVRRGLYGEGFSWSAADRVACALGVHPCELWGDDWLEVARVYEAKKLTEDELCERRKARYVVWQRGRRAAGLK